MRNDGTVAQVGLDVHRRFSMSTARDGDGRVLWRERLRHEDRDRLRAALAAWPKGTPVVMEATFGWGWMSDEVVRAGLEPHLASSTKVAAWRALVVWECQTQDFHVLAARFSRFLNLTAP